MGRKKENSSAKDQGLKKVLDEKDLL